MKKLLFFILIVQLFIPHNREALAATNLAVNISKEVIVSLANKERRNMNLSSLIQNDLLQKAAQLKADDMAARGYFSHTSPDGKLPWQFFKQVGYKYTHAGENLAVNFFDSMELAQAWMNSPAHRANIMKKGFTEIGIGIATGIYQGKNTVFVAEFFGSPVPTKVSYSKK